MIQDSMRWGIALVALLALPASAQANRDARDRQAMIEESVRSYPGNCPCPYFSDRAGRSCGKRSAHSRAGGYAPKCYATDISDKELADWRKRQ